jgi:hypothetical protein
MYNQISYPLLVKYMIPTWIFNTTTHLCRVQLCDEVSGEDSVCNHYFLELIVVGKLRNGKGSDASQSTCSLMQCKKIETAFSTSWGFSPFFLIIFFLHCCDGYVVAFTMVLTMYQIYHAWIYLLYHSPSSLSPNSWSCFNSIIFAFTYTYTHFLHHIHPPTCFPQTPPPNGAALSPGQDLFCPPVL